MATSQCDAWESNPCIGHQLVAVLPVADQAFGRGIPNGDDGSRTRIRASSDESRLHAIWGKTIKTQMVAGAGFNLSYIPAVGTGKRSRNPSAKMDTMGIEPKTGLITTVSAGRPVNGKPRHPKEKQKEVL